MLDLYKNIRARRIALKMTQTDLALASGYTNKSSIASIELGKVDLPLSKIKVIASALDTTPSALFGWSEMDSDPALKGYSEAIRQKKIDKLPEQGITELDNYIDYLVSKYSE